jgi:hypothetical protein
VKRVSLILMAIMLFGCTQAMSAVLLAGHLGVKIENVKDPGATMSVGSQEKLGDHDFLRLTYQSVNFGNEDLNNLAAMEVHYFGLADKWDLGTRIAADYQTDNGDVGMAIGIEFLRKEFIPNLSAFICFDAINKNEIGSYFNFGLGLIADLGK